MGRRRPWDGWGKPGGINQEQTGNCVSISFPLGGSVNWRSIAGTSRLSAHSWGIAIDLNARYGAYWRWQKSPAPESILNLRRSYPGEIVKIFEAQGFIWGGKWSHYDLMHFEYRPELLAKEVNGRPA